MKSQCVTIRMKALNGSSFMKYSLLLLHKVVLNLKYADNTLMRDH